jgi:hypothetical protein
MVDACAGGTLNSVTYKEAMTLFCWQSFKWWTLQSIRWDWNKEGMLFIAPGVMPEVKKSMEDKGILIRLQEKTRLMNYTQ